MAEAEAQEAAHWEAEAATQVMAVEGGEEHQVVKVLEELTQQLIQLLWEQMAEKVEMGRARLELTPE